MQFSQGFFNIVLFLQQTQKQLFKLIIFSMVMLMLGCGGGNSSNEEPSPTEKPSPIEKPIPDIVAPVITLTGASSIQLYVNETYTEAGARANDDVDGTVEVSISGSVNTSIAGVYTLTYTARDSAGNVASVSRTITIIEEFLDTSPPFITLNGASSIQLYVNQTYTEAGARANDDIDGPIEVSITGTVNTSIAGVYTLTYSARDSAGNVSSVGRTITIIKDTSPPVITLNGANSIQLFVNQTYTEQGASAQDNVDGAVEVSVSGMVDTSIAGVYTLTYSASDNASNVTSVKRTITIVKDTSPPVITLNGESSINLFLNETYTEAGASAQDNVDGTVEVTIAGVVDTSTAGDYTLTYSASDIEGNIATVIRAITVIQRPFITRWKTDNGGSSGSNQIMIQTLDKESVYSVDWGDGTSDTQVTGDITHTYAMPGEYTVSISGEFSHLYFDKEFFAHDHHEFFSDNTKLISIEQWGDIKWKSMFQSFADCYYVTSNAKDSPDLSEVSNVQDMFYHISPFADIGRWDVSNITDMSRMFRGAQFYNQDISGWDVSNVTNMSEMFYSAHIINQDISDWDVSNVTRMDGMFANGIFANSRFNQNISGWDVSNVTRMDGMFANSRFNQDISGWDVSNVTRMDYMFFFSNAFNQDIGKWDVSNVTRMDSMFWHANSFNQDISDWDVSNVTDMRRMFQAAMAFNQDISEWDVSNVSTMDDMFLSVTLSSENYDALLIKWSNLPVKESVRFDAGKSQYSAASQSARNVLIGFYYWKITDGGMKSGN